MKDPHITNNLATTKNLGKIIIAPFVPFVVVKILRKKPAKTGIFGLLQNLF
jgi:hypothetical protein